MTPHRSVSLVWLFLGMAACTGRVPVPPEAVQHNTEGIVALRSGDLETASTRFELALEYEPEFVEALSNQGLVEAQRGNFRRAKQLLRRARRLDEDVAQPHHGLGVVAELEGRRDTASDHYRAALAVDPGFAPARANLARLLFDAGHYWHAKLEFEKLIEVAPDDVTGVTGLAETLIKLGRFEEAEHLVRRASGRFGEDARIIVLLARGDLRQGRVEHAIRRLKPLALREDESSVVALAWMAVAELARGRPRHALGAANRALELDATDPIARHAMRRAVRSLGRPHGEPD